MKIAVLEWICGGGLQDTARSDIPDSLFSEGNAMLRCLAANFANAGDRVYLAVDSRFADEWRDPPAGCFVHQSKVADPNTQDSNETVAFNDVKVPEVWLKLAAECDLVVVVAPEFDDILRSVLAQLRRCTDRLFNCSGNSLKNACDKWLMAGCLEAAGIPHPETRLLSPNQRLDAGSVFKLKGPWVVKPRDGAGCERLAIHSETGVEPQRESCASSGDSEDEQAGDASNQEKFIVQAWCSGDAYSCSAIVDRFGTAHWLPLVTQRFELTACDDSPSLERGIQTLTYRGGCIASEEMQTLRPLELLNETLAAVRGTGEGRSKGQFNPGQMVEPNQLFGWVGVDLIYSAEINRWTVIEVNPRFTTSVLGISKLFEGGLGRLLIDAFVGKPISIPENWRHIEFSERSN